MDILLQLTLVTVTRVNFRGSLANMAERKTESDSDKEEDVRQYKVS